MSKKRFLELDALRRIAALAVVFYHLTTRYNEIYGHEHMTFSVDYGFVGVQIFFILSGFVIYMSLEKVSSLKDFIKRRIKRLYPVYWVAVVTTFIVVSIFGLSGREVSLLSMFGNFLMFHGYLLIGLLMCIIVLIADVLNRFVDAPLQINLRKYL